MLARHTKMRILGLVHEYPYQLSYGFHDDEVRDLEYLREHGIYWTSFRVIRWADKNHRRDSNGETIASASRVKNFEIWCGYGDDGYIEVCGPLAMQHFGNDAATLDVDCCGRIRLEVGACTFSRIFEELERNQIIALLPYPIPNEDPQLFIVGVKKFTTGSSDAKRRAMEAL